jgi:hypothetical protein
MKLHGMTRCSKKAGQKDRQSGKSCKSNIVAGFTTVRDLGTEGAMYDDAGLKKAIEKGVVPGPRMIVATRAIVAKGTYGPQPELLIWYYLRVLQKLQVWKTWQVK